MMESALLVAVPEAEPIVGEARQRHDSSTAVGVPAHITVLYPFLPPAMLDADLRAALAALFARFEPFSCQLTGPRRFPNDLLYLAPAPEAPFPGQ